ncbi:MAG: methyl-accepting chemotaxis protein [Deltaproteobacteria bacterium]|nr:methyl-accepting chemotaxis protein [Deltaproteobacteria bacterium]
MKKSMSLSTRFIAILILLLIVGQGIGTILYLRSSSADLIDSLHKRMQRSIRQAAGVSAEPILNFNFDLLGSYIEETLKDEDVESMKFIGTSGEILKEKKIKRHANNSFIVKEQISLNNTTVGSVEIVYTTSTIDSVMVRNLIYIPLFQGAKTRSAQLLRGYQPWQRICATFSVLSGPLPTLPLSQPTR